jgi:hypothetical protein
VNQNLLAPTSLILVAILNNPHDLEIARVLGWYRLPLRSAPKVVAVDYLAFYQTAAFGEDKWRIQYVAPVRGHELTTRAELLRDEPNHPHAQHEYYKIQLGALISLPEPILADKWRRITFLYTTGDYLLRAHSVNDLVVANDERPLLWQALRERASHNQEYHVDESYNLDLQPEVLAALLGIHEPHPSEMTVTSPESIVRLREQTTNHE